MDLSRGQLDRLFGLADVLSFELDNLHEEDPKDMNIRLMRDAANSVFNRIDEMRCEKIREKLKGERNGKDGEQVEDSGN